MDSAFSGTFGLFLAVFLFLLAVLWFVLPFAVFGVKGLLTRILEEQRRTNALLEAMVPADKRPGLVDTTPSLWDIFRGK